MLGDVLNIVISSNQWRNDRGGGLRGLQRQRGPQLDLKALIYICSARIVKKELGLFQVDSQC